MIKKIFKGLLTFGIIGLGLLNICSSEWILRNNGDYGYSTIDTSLDLNVVNKGQLMTQRFGQTQRMLAFASSEGSRIYFFRSYNQRPYYFVQYKNYFYQGYLTYYYICDYFTGESIGGNCVQHNITDNFAVEMGGFFDSITVNDMWGYDIYTWNCYGTNQLINKVAFGSEQFNKVIMFSAGAGNSSVCVCTDCQALQGSLGVSSGTDFTFIRLGYLNNPPGMTSIIGTGNTELPVGTSTNISCPTVGQLINNYNNAGFSSGLCYSSDRIFDGTSFISVDRKSIFELYSGSSEYVSDLQGFATYCESSVYNSSVCSDFFSGRQAQFSLISKLPKDLNVIGGRKQLYTYCNLYNYDVNATTCVASGVTANYGVEYNNSDVIHSISNGEFSIVSPVTNVGGVDTVFSNSSGYNYSGDIIDNIQNLFIKFTSIFKQQTGNTVGILPNYIIYCFVIILLFKLFRK